MLDSLRGFAALGIAFYHVYLWLHSLYGNLGQKFAVLPNLYKAVPLFAVLSGFLVYRSIRELNSLHDLRSYAKRRILRIYPLYVVSVIAYISFSRFSQDPPSWLQRIVPEILMFPVLGYSSYTYPANWSLYTEELFYVFLPLWILLTQNRPLAAALLGLFAFSIVGSAVSDNIAMFKYFFTGIVLCELMRTKFARELNQRVAIIIFLTGAALLYVDFTSGDLIGRLLSLATKDFFALEFDRPFDPYKAVTHHYTLTLAFSFGLIILGAIKSKLVAVALSWPVFRYFGTISYSIFIWNGLIISYGTSIRFHGVFPMVLPENPFLININGSLVSYIGLYGAAILFFSSVSYAVIERPFLLAKAKLAGEAKPATRSKK